MKNKVKKPVYKLIRRLLNSDFMQTEMQYAFKDRFVHSRHKIAHEINYINADDYGLLNNKTSEHNPSPIFISARFRSGSTFLWNIFRHIEQCTAYYEPLNEYKFFLEKNKRSEINDSHLGVGDYKQEYSGLNNLDEFYKTHWVDTNLYMDNEFYEPDLEHYITELINHAKGTPVLQFNRMDFRLPWLRAHYPEAKILHMYRHPRQQWISVQGKKGRVASDFPYTGNEGFFLFYTTVWANDLKKHFPFLEPTLVSHPYALHYYLWKLSYLFGKKYADYSVSYEELINNFDEVLPDLLQHSGITQYDLVALRELKQGQIKETWKEYAPESWFSEIEEECEKNIKLYLNG